MAEKTSVQLKGERDADIVINNAFIDGLLEQVKKKQEFGLTFPPDYSPSNALMGAYLVLKETKDKNGKCVLESCSQASIANTLMDMLTMGLNMQKKQCYPIAYGNKLSCQVSYHGHKAMAHRYGVDTINAEVIYEGDSFKYHIENGCKVLDEHIQYFENIDMTKVRGAYCVVIFKNGSTYMEVMNINQIKTAWKKGFGYKENSGTHADFTDMMAKKTVTARVCRQIVQQYGDVFAIEPYERAEELESVDIIKENVVYDIEQNANAIDFPDTEDFPEPEPEQQIESEIVEAEGQVELPEFLK